MDLEQIALELDTGRKQHGLVVPPSHSRPGFSIEDGYAVARFLHEERIASGVRAVGVKLGFTNQSIWEALGLTSPFWAPIYDDSVTTRRDVRLDGLVAPRIEPEIVLGTRSDLVPGASTTEISAAVDWVAPGFEIVQCHYPDWVMAPADAVADAGLHGALVVGDRVSGPADDVALASTRVVLELNGTVVAEGKGADALGGPVEAVSWLLRLPGVDGLPAGSIVTTGTLTAAFPIAAGERWRSVCSGPTFECHLEVAFS